MGDLKARLLRASAGVNRGLSCREGEQEEIFQIVEDLEVRITGAKRPVVSAGVGLITLRRSLPCRYSASWLSLTQSALFFSTMRVLYGSGFLPALPFYCFYHQVDGGCFSASRYEGASSSSSACCVLVAFMCVPPHTKACKPSNENVTTCNSVFYYAVVVI